MKLNRKWLLIVSLVLSVAMATGGTLAYLSDTKADVNVMTLGSVCIEQNEHQRVDNTKAGQLTEDEIESFEQGQQHFPRRR